MSETPRCEPGEGLRVLLELATLINLVNPETLPEFPRTSSTEQLSPSVVLWHRFIDALAWLADYRKGGESVTAVSGVEISGRPRVLLASNYKVKKEVADHIRRVIKILQSLNDGETQDCAAVLEDITASSVHISRDKVHNYSLRLRKLVRQLIQTFERSSEEDGSPLHRKLAEVLSITYQHRALCQWAYQYSKSPDFGQFDEKCSQEPKIALLHGIRHYIGRLSSWHRAASKLVLAAIEIPDLVTGLSVEIVPQHPTAWRSANTSASLRDLIDRLDLGLNVDHVLQKLQVYFDRTVPSDGNPRDNLSEVFAAKFGDRSFKPTIHAEVMLADYMFTGQLSFINDDRYIGCSKPACILCRLYLEAHPIRITPPPCHGNLWPQWSPPLCTSRETSERIDTLTDGMILYLRALLWNRLMYGQTISQRLPDSVTGITSTNETQSKSKHVKIDFTNKIDA